MLLKILKSCVCFSPKSTVSKTWTVSLKYKTKIYKVFFGIKCLNQFYGNVLPFHLEKIT